MPSIDTGTLESGSMWTFAPPCSEDLPRPDLGYIELGKPSKDRDSSDDLVAVSAYSSLNSPLKIGKFKISYSKRDADYQLLTQIASTKGAIVYSARQSSTNRAVAVKIIEPRLSVDTVKLAACEVSICSLLNHPRILPAFEFGIDEEANRAFIVMPRIQGDDWSKSIDQMSLQENLRIFFQILDAVKHAHSKGVIHRDIKPQNILIDQSGNAYLVDWGRGVSASMREDPEFQEMSRMGGTPAYMPPECATEGKLYSIDERIDVYLMGATLYRILTGTPPHRNARLSDVINDAAQNSIATRESSNPQLLAVALHAMSTQPADRYESIELFQNAIRKALNREAIDDLLGQNVIGRSRPQVYTELIANWERCREAFRLDRGDERAAMTYRRVSERLAIRAARSGEIQFAAYVLNEAGVDNRWISKKIESLVKMRLIRSRIWLVASSILLFVSIVLLLGTSIGVQSITHNN